MYEKYVYSRILNNILFEQNFTCMLKTWNLTIKFSKVTSNQKIYKEFGLWRNIFLYNITFFLPSCANLLDVYTITIEDWLFIYLF